MNNHNQSEKNKEKIRNMVEKKNGKNKDRRLKVEGCPVTEWS